MCIYTVTKDRLLKYECYRQQLFQTRPKCMIIFGRIFVQDQHANKTSQNKLAFRLIHLSFDTVLMKVINIVKLSPSARYFFYYILYIYLLSQTAGRLHSVPTVKGEQARYVRICFFRVQPLGENIPLP